MPRLLSGRVGRALLLGLAVSLGVSALSRVGALAGWETRAVDTFLALRDRGSAPDLVIIPIDEAAFRELGERQPLSRRYLADLTGLLVSSGARVVAFDVQFRRPPGAGGRRAARGGLARRLHRRRHPAGLGDGGGAAAGSGAAALRDGRALLARARRARRLRERPRGLGRRHSPARRGASRRARLAALAGLRGAGRARRPLRRPSPTRYGRIGRWSCRCGCPAGRSRAPRR